MSAPVRLLLLRDWSGSHEDPALQELWTLSCVHPTFAHLSPNFWSFWRLVYTPGLPDAELSRIVYKLSPLLLQKAVCDLEHVARVWDRLFRTADSKYFVYSSSKGPRPKRRSNSRLRMQPRYGEVKILSHDGSIVLPDPPGIEVILNYEPSAAAVQPKKRLPKVDLARYVTVKNTFARASS
jgi:hypothetical protein